MTFMRRGRRDVKRLEARGCRQGGVTAGSAWIAAMALSRGRDAPPTVWALDGGVDWECERNGYGCRAVVHKPRLHRGKLGGGREGKAKL